MTECTRLSDRMPAVAQGLARWTADEESHLVRCADCTAEWALVRSASASGRKVVQALDAGRTAERVIAALRQPAVAPRKTRVLRWAVPLALAASVVLLLLRPRAPEVPQGESGLTLSLLPEVETLSETDLESVIRLLPVEDPADLGDTDSLTDEELNLMLQDFEG